MQVLWLGKPDIAVTWEPESSLPPAVLEEFEQGIHADVVEYMDNSYGQHAVTLGVARSQGNGAKRPRIDRPVIDMTTGLVLTPAHNLGYIIAICHSLLTTSDYLYYL